MYYSIVKDRELPELTIDSESKKSLINFLERVISQAGSDCTKFCHASVVSSEIGANRDALAAHQTSSVLIELRSIIADA